MSSRKFASAVFLIMIAATGCAAEEVEGEAVPVSAATEQTSTSVSEQSDEAATPAEPVELQMVAPGELAINADSFDGVWPFGEPEAVVGCNDETQAVWVRLSGGLYALNGVAISAGMTELDLETPNSVWLDNPATNAKVSLGDVSSTARTLCS